MNVSFPAAIILAIFVSTLHAQATRPTGAGLEPGEAESRQRATTAALPKTWSHPATEIRGVWMASQDILKPRAEILAKLDALRDANFNAVFIDAYFRGYVAYPGSAILSQYPEFHGEDVLGMIVDECHKRGLAAHVWISYGFYAYFTPDASKDKSMGKILDEHPELLSVDSEGHKFIHRSFGDFYSMCPSNPKSHEILAKLAAEAAAKYPFDGLHLDRIRYADDNYCYCDYCKTHFHEDTGATLSKTLSPEDAKKFLQWKREQTCKAVERIVQAARAVRPNLATSSYVVGPDEMDSKAQGWDLWAKRGLLDAVAVSMYGADIRPASERALKLLDGDPSRFISAISCEQQAAVYLGNVEISRGYRGIGQITWYLGKLSDDELAGLKQGPYAQPARSTLGH